MFRVSFVNAFCRTLCATALLATTLMLAGTARAEELRLLMFEQAGCAWCAAWDAQVGIVYARTAEGRAAPLQRTMIDGPPPPGVLLERPVRFTPTFVLLRGGREVGRIEGYPGEDFFYGLLQRLIARARRMAESADRAGTGPATAPGS